MNVRIPQQLKNVFFVNLIFLVGLGVYKFKTAHKLNFSCNSIGVGT